ncbi:MAG: hypothetical protein K9N49_10555, partial [Candidatus Marinimicrobia bacterium]|nr:hypothetical protein [Candidatus Neomarinimicrobiota bacterium]
MQKRLSILLAVLIGLVFLPPKAWTARTLPAQSRDGRRTWSSLLDRFDNDVAFWQQDLNAALSAASAEYKPALAFFS